MQPVLKKYSKDLRALALIFALIIICLFFNVATGGIFLSAKNITNLTRQSSIVGLLSVGMVLVIVTGNIDLSVGSLTGLTGGLSAIVAFSFGFSLPMALLTALVVGALAGLIQGYIVAYLRLPSFIVTLGGLMIFRGLIKGATSGETITVSDSYQYFGEGFLTKPQGWIVAVVTILVLFIMAWRKYKLQAQELTKKSLPGLFMPAIIYSIIIIIFIVVFNNNTVKFAALDNKSIPVPVIILMLFAVAFNFTATKTVFGRRIFAIGGNAQAAYLSGINIRRNTMLVFVIMGLLSAVAGIVYTARVGSAAADAGRNLELDAIAACVIGGTSLMGGKGSVAGAIVGALIMSSLDNGMSIMNIQDFYQDIIKGVVLVLAVYMDVRSKRNS